MNGTYGNNFKNYKQGYAHLDNSIPFFEIDKT